MSYTAGFFELEACLLSFCFLLNLLFVFNFFVLVSHFFNVNICWVSSVNLS
jgi:hypothetical protein